MASTTTLSTSTPSFTFATTSGTQTPNCTTPKVDEDFINEVYAHNGCFPGQDPVQGECYTKGTTMPDCQPLVGSTFCLVTDTFVEVDMCIWGQSVGPGSNGCTGAWKIDMGAFCATDFDFLGTMAHEFGHALGLGHNADPSVMLAGQNCQTTWRRHPFGDDIEGMRTIYPFSNTDDARWREMTGTSWSGETTVTSIDGPWGVRAAVGKRGAAENVVVTELNDHGSQATFNRATYPISGSSSWSSNGFSVNTWRPPAVTGHPLGDAGGEVWVGAVAREQQLATDCPGIKVYRSTDGFQTQTNVNLTDHCGTPHEPALTYDKGTGRFVMAYVRRDNATPGVYTTDNGKIYFRTSTDGTTWTSPQATTFYTIDAPDIACSTSGSDCLLAFIRGGSNSPVLRNRKFTVNSTSPYITVGAETSSGDAERTPPAGVRTYNSADDWFLGYPFFAGNSARSMGESYLYYDRDGAVPFSSFSWTNIGNLVVVSHGPAFASVPASSRIYIWYVR